MKTPEVFWLVEDVSRVKIINLGTTQVVTLFVWGIPVESRVY